jgi:uncharacterized repeat protein (TIGR03803 family)
MTTAGVLTTLHTFAPIGSFAQSVTLVQGADGHLYGTRDIGNMVFRVTRTGAFTVLHVFTNADPAYDSGNHALVPAPDGSLYGVATVTQTATPQDAGGIYRVTTDGAIQHVADLGGVLGANPSGLMLGSDGRLYGTSRQDRPGPPSFDPFTGRGVAFSVLPGEAPVALHAFSTPDPVFPNSQLVEAANGKLHGTASGGYDVGGFGTAYRFDSPGVTNVHSFTGTDGADPAGLALGADGLLYGATRSGGPGDTGTVFRVAADGTLTSLGSTSLPPQTGPTLGSDGLMYQPVGVLANGAAILRIAADGSISEAFNVTSSELDRGQGLWAPLGLASDGRLIGVTIGGLEQEGTIFAVATDGVGSLVHRFPGSGFRSGLVQSGDGKLYGVSANTGPSLAGEIYAVTLDGQLTTLHQFNGLDSIAPVGRLLEVSPGRFLGITHGLHDLSKGQFGAIFEITSAGAFRIVHRFSWLDGAHPLGGLTRTSSGEIYGVTYRGGTLGGGVIFRLVDR